MEPNAANAVFASLPFDDREVTTPCVIVGVSQLFDGHVKLELALIHRTWHKHVASCYLAVAGDCKMNIR